MKYIVTHQVRQAGALGCFIDGQFTLECTTAEQARDQAFEAWHARGCETAGFSVHEEATRRLVLGGETSVCARYAAEARFAAARGYA